MRRRLFNLSSLFSLILLAASIYIWWRNAYDPIYRARGNSGAAGNLCYFDLKYVRADHGYFCFGSEYYLSPPIVEGDTEALNDPTRMINPVGNMPRLPESPWYGSFRTFGAKARLSTGGGWRFDINIKLLTALTALLPLCWVVKRWKDWQSRIPPGHCQKCGYDLRATPDRCPECGTIPASPLSSTAP